ncbi:MAG: amidohydrolase [Deltaproteobacteria bacterium]|nr:amidohydrolase [Deltaproteobacteria bacterium]NND29850.1 amidohydrolase [Myxococcales bacterium]MBT8466954.1 amidohydrolase [Deltaproteobacteria bacterium]MBT8482681.1 amidohydrolase [Deltaproteobacteria bacterium]NNK07698.1 amidohydrolase [Myxococcales bacterium]
MPLFEKHTVTLCLALLLVQACATGDGTPAGGGGNGGAMTNSGPECRTPSGPYEDDRRIDAHAHLLPDFYLTALGEAGITVIGGIPLVAVPMWTPETAIEFMDAHGIAIQLLSFSDPAVSFLPPSEQGALARTMNEYIEGVMQTYPTRFGGFATVPMDDMDEAVSEVSYALDDLGLDGVGLLSSYEGVYLGDPSFDPLLQELNDRGAWVFVHPREPPDDDKPIYPVPVATGEYPFDTSRTFLSLFVYNVFGRYPDIRWQFAHGGGTVPMLQRRMTATAAAAEDGLGPLIGLPPEANDLTEGSARDALQASYYDSALVGACPSLAAVKTMAGDEHLVFGSDWPFAFTFYGEGGDPQPQLSEAFDDDARQKVEFENLLEQFPRLQMLLPDETAALHTHDHGHSWH